MTFSQTQGDSFRRRIGGAGRILAFGLALSLPTAALTQESPDCARLRAALAAPATQDAGAAVAANQMRGELDRATAYARSIGCDNQQFLIFGQAPPPQCATLRSRIAGMRAQFDSLRARAYGDGGQRQALSARYNATCVQRAAPQRGFWETLFGGGQPQDQAHAPAPPPLVEEDGPLDDEGDSHAHGGSQAVCVRTCDGGFFPLSVSARSASDEELTELCKALCPNAEVRLYSRNPARDISTALGADGTAYSDLPNALKYTKVLVPECGCKPPHQSWVEALGPAEQLLGEMGGAKASDATITEQQSQSMSLPSAPKPGKGARKVGKAPDVIAPPPIASPLIQTPAKTVQTTAPDGSRRQIRVVGPNL
jgi:hypothetical protein